MSHRDEEVRTASETNAQALESAIRDLLQDCDASDVTFRKDCGWRPLGLIAAALLWAWSSRNTLTGRLEQALKVVRGWTGGGAPKKASYQAFMKLLVRWTATLRLAVVLTFRRRMEREFPEAFRIAGYVVIAGDGSKLQLPRTRSNEDRFSPGKSRKARRRKNGSRRGRRPRSRQARARQARDKKADSPQMQLTALHHVGLRLPWDWRLGASDVSEREHLREMIADLPPDALLTADCGFVGYDFQAELLAGGHQFVIRVGGNVRLLKKLGVVRESQGTVYLWPDRAAKRGRKPLVLRLVTVHDGRQTWHLVTSVLDRRRLSDRQVAEIYGRRWRIEVFFRHFKQTFGRAKLRSRIADHAHCEAQWSLLGLWAMLLHARLRRRLRDEPLGGLSVARVLRAFAETIDESSCRPEPGQSLGERLILAVVDSYRRRAKTSRDYPRKKYESPTKPPRVSNATKSQRQLAQRHAMEPERKGLTA